MVTCGQNSQPGGPTKGTYGLFATPDRLKKAFNDDIGNVSLVNCPGERKSPVGWHFDESPNSIAGMIACGKYNDHPNVIWTNDRQLMLSDVTGGPRYHRGPAHLVGRLRLITPAAVARARIPPGSATPPRTTGQDIRSDRRWRRRVRRTHPRRPAR